MNIKHFLATTSAYLAAAALVAACDKPLDPRMGQDATQAPAQAEETMTAKRADSDITAAVSAAMSQDPALSTLRIEVDTTDGRVALRGTVPDAESRERATALATSISGVLAVDNQLTVEVKG